MSKPVLLILDPEMAQEIFVTKNKIVDKDGFTQQMFEDLIGNSFSFSKGDEKW